MPEGNKLAKPKVVLQDLRSAARSFWRTRDRSAIYVYLTRVYSHYVTIKDAKKVPSYRRQLIKLTDVRSYDKTPLANILVRLSAPTKFTAARASLLGGLLTMARQRRIAPEELESTIRKQGGISRVYTAWKGRRNKSAGRPRRSVLSRKLVSALGPPQGSPPKSRAPT